MDNISNITKQTLLNLSKKDIEATPKEYANEFCQLAKKGNLSVEECDYFKYALGKISQDELDNCTKQIETVYDLIDILLQRVERKNIDKMSELFQQSIQPSIALTISEDLNAFSIKIGDSPSLIFEESIQQEMEKFIEERFAVDKKIVAQKTADIARLITLMSKYLGDAIDSSKNGSSTVSDIKNKIKSISITGSTKEELNRLQSKLVQAAITIENEMNAVNKNLESGKDEVSLLENRIKDLEVELKETKKSSGIDHLTKTLNRKSFEEKLKIYDEQYERLGSDYAIVFFDLDFFKKINDTYGHEGGDIILKTFASLLLKLTRDIDIVGRFGGEEFIVAVNYNNMDELYNYISRVKNIVTKNKFIYKNHKIKVTFSAGVELRSANKSSDEVISNADKSLYKAKNSGRDKIVFWNGKEL